MTRYILAPSAKGDLEEIYRYTRTRWGAEQAARCLAELNARMIWLAGNPASGQNRDDLISGLFSYPQGSHIIFYRLSEADIRIVRVLHVRMSVKVRLNLS